MHKAGRLRSFFLILLLLSLAPSSVAQANSIVAASTSSIKYTYDAAGRLISVTDPNNGSATYAYDAVGNLLSISRTNAASSTGSADSPFSPGPLRSPALSLFTPESGKSGTHITLQGANFSPILDEDTVKVGGLDAQVISARSTQIVAIVPPGAQSGTISVTTPSGTVTSSLPFTVPPPVQNEQDPPVTPLPPLQAAPGVTGLAGRVLQLDGQPLAGVELSIGSQHTLSDTTGRFLLQNVPSGHQELQINGDQAPNGPYGFFEESVNLPSGKTSVLPWNTWMPRLDLKHAVHFPSPTKQKVVITNPGLPGFEVIIHPAKPACCHGTPGCPGSTSSTQYIFPPPRSRKWSSPIPVCPALKLLFNRVPSSRITGAML